MASRKKSGTCSSSVLIDEGSAVYLGVMTAYVADPAAFVREGFQLLKDTNPTLVSLLATDAVGALNPTEVAGWALMYYSILAITSKDPLPAVDPVTRNSLFKGASNRLRRSERTGDLGDVAKEFEKIEEAFEAAQDHDVETNQELSHFWVDYHLWCHNLMLTRGPVETSIATRGLVHLALAIHAQRNAPKPS